MKQATGIFLKTNPTVKILVFIALFSTGCATYKPQESPGLTPKKTTPPLNYSVFIAGGFGSEGELSENVLTRLKDELSKAPDSSALIFTGDNIEGEDKFLEEDVPLLDQQLQLTQNFKGTVYFTPGNNEWKTFNTKKLERTEEYLDSLDLDDVHFFPKNGCPIEYREINDKLDIIFVDSKWFISNWSRIENMNYKCTNIKTRRRFVEELEGYINDGQDKNIIIAMHHPVFSNGMYGGQESLNEHLTPVPVIGTLLYGLKDLGAFSPDRLQSRRYNYLRILVTTLAKASDRITVVSGHEESLQYLSGGDIYQIIGGSVKNATATHRTKDRITTIGGTLPFEGKYTYGRKGFARLDYYTDGSSQVTFFPENEPEQSAAILPALPVKKASKKYRFPQATTKKEAVLEDPDALYKSCFYKFMWGERYRTYFGESVTAPIANLDTLYGGLRVTKEGGGHQSYSIRLKDDNDREYAMRSLRKNALKFLKFKVKGISYTADDFKDTWAEEVISDFFTTAHPYMQLVVSPLARTVGVNHSSPSLYYIPKQDALGDMNEEFGNELYFIEERPSDEQLNFKGYRRTLDEKGEIKDFESTTDMLERLQEDESYTVDQRNFIRARVFDMLIGDWDRHQDQWRWVEYEKPDGNVEFYPVPRDRDNTFPKFDGLVFGLVKLFVPDGRRFQTYKDQIKSVKWLNNGGNKLDQALLNKMGADVWEEEAMVIKDKLNREAIAQAFSRLPVEVQDSTSKHIQQTLIERLETLPEAARKYGEYLEKTVIFHGTEKDDLFEIIRNEDGTTRVIIKRLLSDEKNELMVDRTLDPSLTEEIWIYGLGDDDEFEVRGVNPKIKVRLIGGYGEDEFRISQKSRLKVYDWKYEETDFPEQTPSHRFTNVYKTNTYHWRYFEENNNILVPNIGFRTDDGFFLGMRDVFNKVGFAADDFTQQHTIDGNYYFKFEALEASYKGIFTNIFPSWNFELGAYYASNRFNRNFFGTGNETQNLEDDLDIDFYRSRIRILKFDAGIAYQTLRFKAIYESFRVQEMEDRLFNTTNFSPELFEAQSYVGGETSLYYYNDDAKDFPGKAIWFGLTAGYKWNTVLDENQFGYAKFRLAFSQQLIPSGDLVLGSTAEVMTNFGDNYFFYHAPRIGGNNGLRGYRDERFTGKTYFYQNSDLRLRLKRIITPVMPVTFGIYGGFDYGRVWQPGESSSVWHTSQGGGIWISGINFLAFNAGFFNSEEGNMIQIGFGFGF